MAMAVVARRLADVLVGERRGPRNVAAALAVLVGLQTSFFSIVLFEGAFPLGLLFASGMGMIAVLPHTWPRDRAAVWLAIVLVAWGSFWLNTWQLTAPVTVAVLVLVAVRLRRSWRVWVAAAVSLVVLSLPVVWGLIGGGRSSYRAPTTTLLDEGEPRTGLSVLDVVRAQLGVVTHTHLGQFSWWWAMAGLFALATLIIAVRGAARPVPPVHLTLVVASGLTLLVMMWVLGDSLASLHYYPAKFAETMAVFLIPAATAGLAAAIVIGIDRTRQLRRPLRTYAITLLAGAVALGSVPYLGWAAAQTPAC